MSYSLTDQYVIDRVTERAAGVFAYVPEPHCWLRYAAEGWQREAARERLHELYVAVVCALGQGDDTKRALHLLRERLSGRGSEWVLRQLSMQRELVVPFRCWNNGALSAEVAAPGDFMTRRALRDPLDFLESESLRSMIDGTLTNRHEIVQSKFSACLGLVRMHDAPDSPQTPLTTGSLLIIRRGEWSVCLSVWYRFLREWWGDYVVRLPLSVWRQWPRGLDRNWAFHLRGARFIFLESPERWEKFPGMALSRLVAGQEAFFPAGGGEVIGLSLGGLFFLEGPMVPDKGATPLNTFESGLLDRTLLLPGVHLGSLGRENGEIEDA